MDAQELAKLMKRAKDLLAAGDIPSARLLLERAAEGQDANAALILARTYDPAALGTLDVRNITPEPDKARTWYQRAAKLGSAEAQRLLAQLPN
jgi:TPR repeat protein